MSDTADDPMGDPLVDLVVEEPGWERALPDLGDVATLAAELALDAAGTPADRFAISLLACNDDRIGALNAQFRGRPKPTNVLSWPAFPLAPPGPGQPPPQPPVDGASGDRQPLGDVAIALETVVREAEQRGFPLKNHATHLILHGCLHLLGYDHQIPQDAVLMEDLERRALARAGIPDPYE
ncbi:MAG TPA: rRNA maturation RNase YbeY [Paracoccaceae bacterium]|nr:rRNA maturation RNase YbeY [Paracoccaceae bacterium]